VFSSVTAIDATLLVLSTRCHVVPSAMIKMEDAPMVLASHVFVIFIVGFIMWRLMPPGVDSSVSSINQTPPRRIVGGGPLSDSCMTT
jgi:hypothetical protein